MLFSELCDKEVVCADNGVRLGLVDDLEFDETDAGIRRLFIYGRSELLGFGQRSDDVVVEWGDVQTVGGDVILVKSARETPSPPRRRGIFK